MGAEDSLWCAELGGNRGVAKMVMVCDCGLKPGAVAVTVV